MTSYPAEKNIRAAVAIAVPVKDVASIVGEYTLPLFNINAFNTILSFTHFTPGSRYIFAYSAFDAKMAVTNPTEGINEAFDVVSEVKDVIDADIREIRLVYIQEGKDIVARIEGRVDALIGAPIIPDQVMEGIKILVDYLVKHEFIRGKSYEARLEENITYTDGILSVPIRIY